MFLQVHIVLHINALYVISLLNCFKLFLYNQQEILFSFGCITECAYC